MAKKKNKKGLVIFVAVATTISLAGLTGLFGAGGPNNAGQTGTNSNNEAPTPEQIAQRTGVPCLTSEEFHLHPHLTIKIDESEEPLPANIGVFAGCTQELHTHDPDGTIHVESDTDKGYIFQDFLNVWGLGLQQPEFITRLTVDGEYNENDTNFKLEDGQEILLEFISIPSLGSNPTNTEPSQ